MAADSSAQKDRRPPELDREARDRIDAKSRAELQATLRDQYGDALHLDGATGERAAWLACALGDLEKRAHELVVFARGHDGGDAMDRCIDYLDGVLAELTRTDGGTLPLDFEGRPFDDGFVFVRGEVRDYAAERAAAQLLGEDAPASLIRR
jgi:hypothetical protein